jgi:hypothetical protein
MASLPSSPFDSAISLGANYPSEAVQARPSNANSLKTISHPADPRVELSSEELAEAQTAVTQAQDQIEIDDFDSDSAFDAGYETDSIGSTSASITSSVRDFAFENGRRYHKFREGSYNFPNDPSEQEREDMKHAMMVNLLGGRLHFAPIGDNPQNILDMGTGTGIWAIESGLFEVDSSRRCMGKC